MKIKTIKDFAIVELPKEVRSEEEKLKSFMILEKHKLQTFWGKLFGKHEWFSHWNLEGEIGIKTEAFHETEEKAKDYLNKIVAHYKAIDNKIKAL